MPCKFFVAVVGYSVEENININLKNMGERGPSFNPEEALRREDRREAEIDPMGVANRELNQAQAGRGKEKQEGGGVETVDETAQRLIQARLDAARVDMDRVEGTAGPNTEVVAGHLAGLRKMEDEIIQKMQEPEFDKAELSGLQARLNNDVGTFGLNADLHDLSYYNDVISRARELESKKSKAE